jgi:hemoglobin
LGMADFNETSTYQLIGGEAGLRSLMDNFYDLMDSSPEAAKIRAFHGKSLKQSREKLFMFLSGWSGGPQLYIEKFGHPRLRMRHMLFAIGTVERDQ